MLDIHTHTRTPAIINFQHSEDEQINISKNPLPHVTCYSMIHSLFYLIFSSASASGAGKMQIKMPVAWVFFRIPFFIKEKILNAQSVISCANGLISANHFMTYNAILNHSYYILSQFLYRIIPKPFSNLLYTVLNREIQIKKLIHVLTSVFF